VAEAQALLARIQPRALFVAHDLPHLRGAAAVGGRHDAWPTFVDRAPLPSPLDPVDDVAVLLATSGSEGRPKLVAHTATALAGKAAQMAGVHAVGADDTILLPAPMAHVSGLLNGLLLPAASGMRVVLAARWDGERGVAAVERDAVTFLVGPPTLGAQLMSAPGFTPDRVASLRLWSCGGAGVTPAFAVRAAERLGCVVKRTYGSTEAPTVTTSWAGDPVERGWTTDGRSTGTAELRVDESGELWVRGPELFARYWDDPSPVVDGWFPTGDLASLDDEGWLTVTGRRKELIIRAGENVSPAEVEAVCATLPGVAECVVVGVPDDVLGERIGLVVVPAAGAGGGVSGAPTLADVQAHCAAAGLAKPKWPEVVVTVGEIPTLTVGKPDRPALRPLFPPRSV
jgi:cyclohexanecarboxylate-CoA ligase